MYTYVFGAEKVYAPVSGTQDVDLIADNNKTLSLVSATGAIIVNLIAPLTGCISGIILIRQHATVTKDITKFQRNGVDADAIWFGTEPDWAADTAAKYRAVSYKDNGSKVFLEASASS
jgi:hypothetical protein